MKRSEEILIMMRKCFWFFAAPPVVIAAPKTVPVKAKPLPKVPLLPSPEEQEIYGFVLL